jgi:hypothetical protein
MDRRLVVALIVILVIFAFLPIYPAGYGYYPSGLLGAIVLILIVLLLLGRLAIVAAALLPFAGAAWAAYHSGAQP